MAPLTAEVVAILDQRAADRAADQLEERFSEAARGSADTFSRVFGSSLNGGAFTTQLRDVGRTAGAELRTGLTSGVADAVQNFNRQFGAMGDVANTAFAGMSRGAGLAVAGIAGVGVAAIAAGQQLYQLGSTWDSVADGIALRTGKLGEDLDAIVSSVRSLGAETAAPLETIGNVAGQVSQSLGLTGSQLEAMTKTLAEYQAMAGQEIDVRGFGKALDLFNIDPSASMGALDDLYEVSTETGVSINELVGTMSKAGKTAQEFGLDFGETAGLLSAFEQAGLDFSRIAPSMTIALRNFAAAGREPQQALRDTIAEIKALADAGRDAEATTLASETFGGRGYIDFFNAIKSGKLDVDSLSASIDDNDTSLSNVLDATKDWSEEWQQFKNQASSALEPLATGVFTQINANLTGATTIATGFRDIISGLGEAWRQAAAAITGNPIRPDLGIPGNVPVVRGPNGELVPSGNTPGGPNPILIGPQIPPTSSGPATLDDLLGIPRAPGSGGPSAPLPPPNTTTSTGLPYRGSFYTDWYEQQSSRGTADQLPDAPVVPNAPLPSLAPGLQMTSSLFGAQSGLADAQTAVAEKEARLNQLMQSNVATADDIQRARNDAESARQDAHQAEMRFAEAQQSAFESQNKQLESAAGSLEELGAGLDNDFGISKGLAGIADNIVRFVGSLALAGPMAQMNAISAANPNQGSGLIGMLGSQGVFGQQYTPEAIAAANGTGNSGYYSPSALGPAALQPGIGGNTGAAIALAQSADGGSYGYGASDLVNGLADCSGAISDLYEVMTTGSSNSGRAFTTESDFEALGFQRGYQEGALNIGVHNGGGGRNSHMAATLPNGVNFESGGSHGGIAYGGPAAGALDPQFENQYFLPTGAATTGAVGASTPSYAPLTGPALTDPGLTTPTTMPGTGGPGLAGAPQGIGGPSLGGLSFGPQGALAGAQGAAVGTPNAGGVAPAGGTGDGFSGIGGLPMEGMMAAAGAIPGLGAGAQMGMKLANRAIGQMGRYAGIGVSGLMETFLPAGSQLAGNSWFTKLAGGLSGAKPALPNAAGAKGAPPGLQPPGPIQHGQANGAAPGQGNTTTNTTNINVDATSRQQEGQGIARDIDLQLADRNSGVGQ